MFIELKQYAPQKMFLIEGEASLFDVVVISAKENGVLCESLSVPRFTMEHARYLATYMQEGGGEERVFVLYFAIFSPDAAQVMLKSLEEVDPYTTIIFITPRPHIVPATIRSRMQMIRSDAQEHAINETIPSTLTEALAYIKTAFDSDEEEAAVLRAKATLFLDSLEIKLQDDPKKATYVYEAKQLLFKANLPTKQVLEYAVTMTM